MDYFISNHTNLEPAGNTGVVKCFCDRTRVLQADLLAGMTCWRPGSEASEIFLADGSESANLKVLCINLFIKCKLPLLALVASW